MWTCPRGNETIKAMTNPASLQPYMDFILEVDRLKTVTRKIKPRGTDRFENPAEHSWQIALLALSLASFADPAVDIAHVIAMLLVHDIGEIDTGDTLTFVEGGWVERKAAELEAVRRIFGLLPADVADRYLALWQEFEAGETIDSRFANAADRAMPVILNLANGGQSWRDNEISYERVVRRVAPPIRSGCPALWDYLEPRLLEARGLGLFGEP